MPEARSKTTKPTVKKTVAKKPVLKKKPVAKTVTRSKTKTTAKKALKVKKVPKKTVVKKTAAPIKPKAKVVKEIPVKAKVTKPVVPRQKKVQSEKTVVLPSRMSIRAREKALVYAEEIERRIQRPAYSLTMAFGLLFVCLGSFVGFYQSSTIPSCDTGVCSAQLVTNPDDVVSTVPLIQSVSLLTTLPSIVDSEEKVTLNTENVEELEVYAFGVVGSVSLDPRPRLNNRYEITLDPDEFEPGSYTLKAISYDSSQSEVTTTLGQFDVLEEQILTTSTPTDETTDSDGLVQVPLEQDFVDLVVQPDPVDSVDLVVQPPASTIESDPEVTVVTTDSQQLVPLDTITVMAAGQLSGATEISIQSSIVRLVSVYLRRTQSIERQLVGQIYSTNPTFTFDTRDFPNGEYELYVEATSNTDTTVSNSLQVNILNELDKVVDVAPINTPLIDEEREILKITPETVFVPTATQPSTPIAQQIDSIVQSEPEGVKDATETVDDELLIYTVTVEEPIRKRAIEMLQTDADILDTLFSRYAVAVQSGNQDLVREARLAITAYQTNVVDQALRNEQDRFIADDLSVSLEEEIQQITVKIETFENLRRERNEGSSSKDTDGDGITDTDERVLFKTDPLRADTDGDGFTDGVEIIKGFNPNDAASEAVIVYESPKETIGIVANKNLQVAAVVPDIQLPQSAEDKLTVHTTVRGKGLPNSFVALYVFSTPTVVTVKTEADGSFEYTFSKELEDGEHQVFVALTDNTGDIVAQSEPFTFVKRAEAFTIVDAEAAISETDTSLSIATVTSPYSTVLSMSVLALGVLLILLGIGLRANRPEQTQLEVSA